MMRIFKSWLILLALIACSAANIHAADSADADAQIEVRLKALSTELRCLVCQNTTLADSSAPLAEDLRKEIRVLMHEGKTDEEVKAYLVERYGDFVLYRPPMQANTALLWIGPFIMLLIGAITLIVVLKKRSSIESSAEPSELESGEDK
jgi:cytochrome c-type biogenesis protein CcmH